MRRLVAGLVVLTGCGRVGFDAIANASPDAANGTDARDGGDPTPLGPFGPWQPPIRQPTLNTNSQEFGPGLSADGLEVFFGTRWMGNSDVWRATRSSTSAAFGPPVLISELMTADEDAEPSIAKDGVTLVFQRYIPMDTLWTTTRTGATWSVPAQLAPTVELAGFGGADFGPGDLSLVVHKNGELFEATRGNPQASWSAPKSLGIAGVPTDGSATMRSDGLEILWESGIAVPTAIYRATRASRDDPFGPRERVMLGGVFDSNGCGDPDLSENGQVMVFVSNEPGSAGLYDIYTTQRAPL